VILVWCPVWGTMTPMSSKDLSSKDVTTHSHGATGPTKAFRPLAIALPLVLLLTGCAAPAGFVGQHQSADPAGADGITVYFNQRPQGSYLSPLTGTRRRGDDLEQAVVDAIAGARSSISLAVQELTLPPIAQALVERHRAGVQVRVVLENSYSTPWSYQHPSELSDHERHRWQRLHDLADADQDGTVTQAERRSGDAVALLLADGVPLVDDTADGTAGSGLMHHKFLVVDGQEVVTGSANFTSSGVHGDAGAPWSRGNTNHLVRIHSPALAGLFEEEFARLWGDGPHGLADSRFGLSKSSGASIGLQEGDAHLEVLFAPHSRQDHNNGLQFIERVLATAKEEVDMALFVFSDQGIADRLKTLAQDGVRVRLLVDPGFATRSYSELLDLAGVTRPDHRCRVEEGNKPWPEGLAEVGVPQLERGDKLHHKFAVVEGTTVITGSFNWSASAAHQNDETILVIKHPKVASAFSDEFGRLWQNAELGITPRLQQLLERDRLRCPETLKLQQPPSALL